MRALQEVTGERERIHMDTINMGILAAGSIAVKMAETITRMSSVRPCAVASRDASRAAAFAEKYGFAKSCGSYQELVDDPDVQLVYVASPHSHHYAHAKLCLEHGKHVLCEKAFTVNERQAGELCALARERGLLLAEAIWTRYMPFSRTIRQLLDEGAIGTVTALTANLGYRVSHLERMYDPALAGGALLDLGVYPLNFALMCLGTDIVGTASTFIPFPSGVDAQNSITLSFGGGEMAVLFSSMLNVTDRKGVIYGTDGYMVVENINNPQSAQIFGRDWQPGKLYQCPPQISGYEYEVEAAVRAIREGKVECPEMPYSETLRVMNMCDSIRAGWGMRFPCD